MTGANPVDGPMEIDVVLEGAASDQDRARAAVAALQALDLVVALGDGAPGLAEAERGGPQVRLSLSADAAQGFENSRFPGAGAVEWAQALAWIARGVRAYAEAAPNADAGAGARAKARRLIAAAMAAGAGARPDRDAAAAPACPGRAMREPAAADWTEIADALDPARYRVYLARHPTAPQATEARTRLRQLAAWEGLDPLDAAAVDRFARDALFPALSHEAARLRALVCGAEDAAMGVGENDDPAAARRRADVALLRRKAALRRAPAFGARAALTREPASAAAGGPDGEASRLFADRLLSGRRGPEMISIPAAMFVMGAPGTDRDRRRDEGPQRRIEFAERFALGRFAVTFEEYDAFCAAMGRPFASDEGWGRGRRPVVNVSQDDAKRYCDWLSEQTGAHYRLPSEAEWECACRAGTTTRFWWGDEVTPERANYGRQAHGSRPVDAYAPNQWGLFQTHGNVLEWCDDCWSVNHRHAPSDGRPNRYGDAGAAVIRGGAWNHNARYLRSSNRSWGWRDFFYYTVGFRLARGAGA